MLTLRKSESRGQSNHGWLKSKHSFSFAEYYDPSNLNFGPLRVINEDRVAAGMGFGTHGHRDMEIISYVLGGQLGHRDSMGNGSVIVPGDVQRMSAGTGVLHSEMNPSPSEAVHFLQIWVIPNQYQLTPSYEQKHFPVEARRGQLRLILSPAGEEGSLTLHQDAHIFAGEFDGEEAAHYALGSGRQAYIHLARGRLTVNGTELNAGDALEVVDERALHLADGQDAEVLLFDLPA